MYKSVIFLLINKCMLYAVKVPIQKSYWKENANYFYIGSWISEKNKANILKHGYKDFLN